MIKFERSLLYITAANATTALIIAEKHPGVIDCMALVVAFVLLVIGTIHLVDYALNGKD